MDVIEFVEISDVKIDAIVEIVMEAINVETDSVKTDVMGSIVQEVIDVKMEIVIDSLNV